MFVKCFSLVLSLFAGLKPLLKVFNDLLLVLDSGNCAILILDLSAAFDTVDNKILLLHSEHCVGINGTVSGWFESYLSDGTFSVHMTQFSSSVAPYCGIPKGSVLGPRSRYLGSLSTASERL